MNRAMTKNFDTLMLSLSKYTRMIIIKLKNLSGGNLILHGELHPD